MTVSDATMRAYHRERASGLRAADALRVIRYREGAPYAGIDWSVDRQGRYRATWDVAPFTLRARVTDDDYMEPPAYTVASSPMPGAVRVGRDEWYLPESGYTLPMLADDFRKQGMARGIAWERARASLVAEYHDDTSDRYVGVIVTVTASLSGVDVGSASVGSVVEYGDTRYLAELARDLESEAIADARANAARMCAALAAAWCPCGTGARHLRAGCETV